ncbi:MAG: diaminopimelate decarboxylase [Candidatus Syntrophoarchaeum butanivorans]|uniref:Diaminopimelate decarboxylase n=1 Tax=Candidatus Syntropharchaeum butanivorans TaxID=1839936 RepID=A0A1F2P712_9EURY|nr:MAG: diaminopimelate decarboxylase [Candidatus Syntrophoarchaeum butanivorans]
MRASELGVIDGHLTIGGVDAVKLVERYRTPLYVTDENQVRERFRAFKDAFSGVKSEIYYAMKANGNLAILKILESEGAGVDVFSAGELYMALLAGFPREKILFNGNSKTDEELELAVEAGVTVSVDSLDELEALAQIAKRLGKRSSIAFRVNPDISPKTHPKISTGIRTSKFGIPHTEVMDAYRRAWELDGLDIKGIHCHIGSQILELGVFGEVMERMMNLVEEIKDELGIRLEFLDIGGGLGVAYREDDPAPTPHDLADVVLPVFKGRCKEAGVSPTLILEPGRYIVADSTVLLTRVNTVKRAYKNFVATDAGFNLLARPVLYGSYHRIVVANKMDLPPEETYTIVGPICESGDILGEDRRLPKIEKGDILAILDTGAYGFSMSSQYNQRPRCAEVLVSDGRVELIREEESVGDLMMRQRIPDRLL